MSGETWSCWSWHAKLRSSGRYASEMPVRTTEAPLGATWEARREGGGEEGGEGGRQRRGGSQWEVNGRGQSLVEREA